jgi:hypothetical protein
MLSSGATSLAIVAAQSAQAITKDVLHARGFADVPSSRHVEYIPAPQTAVLLLAGCVTGPRRIVQATVRALSRRVGIEDVTVHTLIRGARHVVGPPRVLRPEHCLAALRTWFRADESVFHIAGQLRGRCCVVIVGARAPAPRTLLARKTAIIVRSKRGRKRTRARFCSSL